MKKIYKTPAIVIVNVQTTKMIAESGFDQALNSQGKGGDYALGRRGGSFFDDEDEE